MMMEETFSALGGVIGSAEQKVSPEILKLSSQLGDELDALKAQRKKDRTFIDERNQWTNDRNRAIFVETPNDPRFLTVVGEKDSADRVVFGPSSPLLNISQSRGNPIAPLPSQLLSSQSASLLGAPLSSSKQDRIQNEPALFGKSSFDLPSKHEAGDFVFVNRNGKSVLLKPISSYLALSMSCFVEKKPVPLHIIDFMSHLQENQFFSLCDIETEEEAKYFGRLLAAGESLAGLPSGSIRVILIVDNPRLLFRLNEVIDSLYPYFAGVAIDWDAYLSSTLDLMKHNSFHRTSSKSLVCTQYTQDAISVVANVVGGRKGLVFGSFNGCSSSTPDWNDPTYQNTLFNFLVDVITQLKRGVWGLWIADPLFFRVGSAVVEAFREKGNEKLGNLFEESFKDPKYVKELIQLLKVEQPFNTSVPSLLAMNVKQSHTLRPLDMRMDIFRSLQFITSWLMGHPHVVLHENAQCASVATLHTLERFRWSLWHELSHSRFSPNDFLRMIHEEIRYIRSNASSPNKLVTIKWSASSSRWYHVAANLLICLVLPRASKICPSVGRFIPTAQTAGVPVTSSLSYLSAFSVVRVRDSQDPWREVVALAPELFTLRRDIELWNAAFSACGCQKFATFMSQKPIFDDEEAMQSFILESMNEDEVIEAASFHGTLGVKNVSQLDESAKKEQAAIQKSGEREGKKLFEIGEEYRLKFGMKFLAAAKGHSAQQLYDLALKRMKNSKEEEVRNAKVALFLIARNRLIESGYLNPVQSTLNFSPLAPPSSGNVKNSMVDQIQSLLDQFCVPGVSVSLFNNTEVPPPTPTLSHLSETIQSFGVGYSSLNPPIPVASNGSTWFEMCSISKTICTAFALDILKQKGISIDTPVNVILSDPKLCIRPSPWRLKPAEGCPPEWADEVCVQHLVDHTGLGMHYVFGVPMTRAQGMPPTGEFLDGQLEKDFGYEPILVCKKPGRDFKYSGGGFIVLQHMMQCLTGHENLAEMTLPFLTALGVEKEMTFEQQPSFVSENQIATGYAEPRSESESVKDLKKAASDGSNRMMFPPFPAGVLGTTRATARFLQHLIRAYNDLEGSGPISHDTAVLILGSFNKRLRSTEAFMCPGSSMGLGAFLAHIGPNWIAFHQASNEGFRALYCICCRGPNAHTGFVVASNGSNNAVLLNSFVSRLIVSAFDWASVNHQDFKDASSFSVKGISQEQIVNIGYKKLLFDSFIPDYPALTPVLGPVDPLSRVDLLCGAEVLEVSDQFFSLASNLVSERVPNFDPTAFGIHGKIMDSWEPQRHNSREADYALFRPKSPAKGVCAVSVSTRYHNGNQAHGIRVEGFTLGPDGKVCDSFELVPKSLLQAHAMHRHIVPQHIANRKVDLVKVHCYPDGGISRVRLFGNFSDLPEKERELYHVQNAALGITIDVPIPPIVKDIQQLPSADPHQVSQNWAHFLKKLGNHPPQESLELDVASSEYGGSVVEVSNQHYGPASSILSPLPSQGMFDGFETSRSRPGSVIPPLGGKNRGGQWVEIRFGKPACIHRIVMDFAYFIGNNPLFVSIEGFDGTDWRLIVPKIKTKAYISNSIEFVLPPAHKKVRLESARIVTYPCGGFNRIHFYSFLSPSALSSNL